MLLFFYILFLFHKVVHNFFLKRQHNRIPIAADIKKMYFCDFLERKGITTYHVHMVFYTEK